LKGRTWIPVLVAVILLFAAGIYISVKYYDIGGKARDYANRSFSRYLGGEFESSSVYFTPWSFGLRDVRLRLKEMPVVIEAKRIRVEFNLFSLIRNDFRLVTGARNVFFDEPKFIWSLDGKRHVPEKLGIGMETELSLAAIPAVRIDIVKGSFVFTRGDSSLVLADGLGGWLDGRSSSTITVNLEAEVLSDSVNTTFRVLFDRDTGKTVLDVVCDSCEFSRPGLHILTGDILSESGRFDLSLHSEIGGGGRLHSGKFSVRDGSFFVKDMGIRVNDVSIEGTIDGDELLFDNATGRIWNVTPEFSGRLALRPEPKLHLTMNAGDVDVGGMFSEIFPERDEYPAGKVDVVSTLDGPLKDLSLFVRISSDSLGYRGKVVRNAGTEMEISGGEVDIRRLDARYGDVRVKGRGRLDTRLLSAKKAGYSFAADLEWPGGANRGVRVKAEGTADVNRDEYTAEYEIAGARAGGRKRAVFGRNDIDVFRGTLHLKGNDLDYELSNPFVRLDGSARDIHETCEIESELMLSRFPVFYYFGLADSAFVVDGGGRIRGTPDDLSADCRFEVNAGENLHTVLSGKLTVADIVKESRNVTFEGRLDDQRLRFSHPMNWELGFRSDSAGIQLTVREPAGAVLGLDIEPGTGNLAGTLDLDEFPLEWIIDVFKKESFSHRGKLTGRVRIDGTVRNPRFHTPEKLVVTDLKIGGLDRLTGSGYVSGGLGELNFTDVNVSRKGIHFLYSDSRWEKGKPYILEASGENVPLEVIGDIISDTRRTDGKAEYSFTMVYTRKGGTIEGDFTVRDGHFYDIPFDIASGKIGGGSDGFRVTDFEIGKEGLYTGKGAASSGYFYKDRTDAPGLRMTLSFEGDLLKVLPHLTGDIKEADGWSRLMLTLGGTWVEPVVMDAELYVSGGEIKPSFLIDRISDIDVALAIDQDFETVTGMKAVRIRKASGTILGKKLVVRNVHVGDPEWKNIRKPEMVSIVNGKANLDFGVLVCRIERGGQKDASVEFNIPGFMKPKERGRFLVSGDYRDSFVVAASDAGDRLTPYLSGSITVLSGDLTYPLLDTSGGGGRLDFLESIFWDLNVHGGPNVNYVHEENIKWKLGGTTVSKTQAKLDENTEFRIYGRLADGSFRITGNARSSSGTISYYGTEFDIEEAELTIDSSNTTRPATLAARARTIVYDDSTGAETEIYLNVYFIDKLSGERKEIAGRTEVVRNDPLKSDTSRTIDAGALGTLQIEFTSSNPADDTIEKILARLGISPDNIVNAATDAFAAGIDNYYFDSLMRPFEDIVRKYIGLDVVRFTPSVLGNFMRSQLDFNDRFGPDDQFVLFDRSRIMLGEYLFDDWFLSYRGQYGVGRDYLRRKERGFYHEIALQYLFRRNTRFQFNYNYDEIIKKGEKRIEIRHDFEF